MMRRFTIALVAALFLVAPPGAEAAGWRWPVRGPVLTSYANDNARPYAGGMHRGIDIGAGVGTPVVAARAGTVMYAGALGAAGVVVAVRAGPYATSYLHLSEVSVSRGDRVAMGERLGAVGTTGRRSVREPHLHFGVRMAASDRYVDPLSLLPGLGGGERHVPAGPLVRRETRLVRHPAVAPAVARASVAVPDRGRPLVWGGVVLLVLVLFGSALVRANAALHERAAGMLQFCVREVRRGLPRACRACLARPGSRARP
jgi:hypothetical protein